MVNNFNGGTPPPEQPESGRGAGGKVRKPNRKPRTTPYARPPLNRPQTPLAVRGGTGSWLSKLVDPACRLIGAGATRLLPSIFSRSPTIESPASSSDDEDHDELQGEAEHEDKDGHDKGSSDLALTGATQSANIVGVEDGSKGGGPFDAKREEKSISLQNADGLLEIEQLIKGKMLSRDEVDHLMQILISKDVDLHMDEGRDKQPAADVRVEVQGPAAAPEFASNLKEELEVWNRVSKEVPTPLSKSDVRNDIGASPVDIARAYMGGRMLEIGSSSVATATGDDRPLIYLEGNSSKPFIASPLQNSSIRWPGATVPDRYLTPQTQRSRCGLHDFRRTPYSTTIHSMSKSKLIQIGDDRNNSVETELPLLKQSQTSINRQARSRSNILDIDYGSVGPIRRPRHKFSLGAPQKNVNLPPLASPFRRENSDSPLGSLPAYTRNMDAGGTSSTAKPPWVDDKPQSVGIGIPTVPRHSSQMARKILEHLDRNFPTPKEKSAELKLATSWKKPISSDSISMGNAAISQDFMEKHRNTDTAHLHESRGTSFFKLPPERGPIRIADAVGRKTYVSDAELRSFMPTNGINAGNADEISKLAPTATDSRPQDGVKLPPVSAAKAGLHLIAIEKPVGPAFSSGNSSGFTFPVSASSSLFPEPPTPSLAPPPSLVNNNHLPKDEASIPSFTFGSNRSCPALVFSFPSTSSSSVPVDTDDIKFAFGSGERRMSFASIARDGVCC